MLCGRCEATLKEGNAFVLLGQGRLIIVYCKYCIPSYTPVRKLTVDDLDLLSAIWEEVALCVT